MVYQWLNFAQSRMFPATCRLCCGPGQPGVEVCAACARELPWLEHACKRCALPLPPEAPATQCPVCLKTPPPLDRCAALFLYQEPVATWIQDLKFHQDLYAAGLFGHLLADTLQENQDPSTLIIPVPLHHRRLAERGYNQALEIARPLRRMGYSIDIKICSRQLNTAAHSGLSARRRKTNIRNAFCTHQRLDGRRFILVDDVLTTGATLNELAGTLKKAGAEWVEARVIARVV